MRSATPGLVALAIAGALACGEPPGVRAQKFVGDFYSWYLMPAEKGGAGGSLETALRSRPQLFDAALLAALREDIAASAKNPGEVAGLDFDPFVNSQDPCEQYLAGPPGPSGTGRSVPVNEICGGKNGRTPALRVEVNPVGDSWQIRNLTYDDSSTISSTLLSILGELKAQRAKASLGDPPSLILGRFEDDYGNAFQLPAALFEQLPRNRFHIVEWKEARYFIARRGRRWLPTAPPSNGVW